MATLAKTQPASGHIAVQNEVTGAFAGLLSLLASFFQAVAVARACEASFNRQGHIKPETLQLLQEQMRLR